MLMKNTKLDKTTFINKAKSYIDYFDSNNDKSYVLEKGIGCVMISSPHSFSFY